MCDVFTRRGQLQLVQQLIDTAQFHLSARLRNGEEMPLLSEVLSVIVSDFKAEAPHQLVSAREVESFALRKFIIGPQPYYTKLRDFYIRPQYLP